MAEFVSPLQVKVICNRLLSESDSAPVEKKATNSHGQRVDFSSHLGPEAKHHLWMQSALQQIMRAYSSPCITALAVVLDSVSTPYNCTRDLEFVSGTRPDTSIPTTGELEFRSGVLTQEPERLLLAPSSMSLLIRTSTVSSRPPEESGAKSPPHLLPFFTGEFCETQVQSLPYWDALVDEWFNALCIDKVWIQWHYDSAVLSTRLRESDSVVLPKAYRNSG